MARHTCRFCTNLVTQDRGICLPCVTEGRTDDPGLPMDTEELDDGQEVPAVHKGPLTTSERYHGPSIRDDI